MANDTRQLAAVQAEAQKLIANRDASRKQATDELIARETGDVIGIARRRESSRMVQAGLAEGASQGDRRRLLVAAAQDQSLQQEIALQERIRDPKGTEGLSAQEIFDKTLVEDLKAQAARETDPLEKARIEQQIVDIEAKGLDELQKEAVKIQTDQLAVQKIIAAQQSALLKAQLEQLGVTRDKLDTVIATETQSLNEQLAAQNQAAQEEQAASRQTTDSGLVDLKPTPVTTAGADVGGSAAGGVITRGNLGEANAPVLVPLTTSPLVAGNTGFNPTEEQILRASGPNPQQQSQQGMENFATILQEGLVAFVEKVDLIQAAAELQNQASERQLEAANGMPTQIAHNMTPIEINGFADLPRALNEFTNNIGAIAQNMIDPSQKYQGPSDQGGGIDPRTLG